VDVVIAMDSNWISTCQRQALHDAKVVSTHDEAAAMALSMVAQWHDIPAAAIVSDRESHELRYARMVLVRLLDSIGCHRSLIAATTGRRLPSRQYELQVLRSRAQMMPDDPWLGLATMVGEEMASRLEHCRMERERMRQASRAGRPADTDVIRDTYQIACPPSDLAMADLAQAMKAEIGRCRRV
jgi:hypothetical protein